MTDSRPELVLVTGATGFIAGHCIAELIAHGYAVRGTVRSLSSAKAEHLHRLGGSLELVEARLDADDGWAAAAAGCTAVLHVASPFPPEAPKDEDELIRPAVDGTLRVLRAAAAGGTVRRVVLTSSVAAVTAGNTSDPAHPLTEADWSTPEEATPYAKSKTLAERAAWRFAAEDGGVELVSINPGMVLGPLQHPGLNTSLEAIQRLLSGGMPAVPMLGFAPVDVRDLATAHRLALESPKAPGNRYICAGPHTWLLDMARTLAADLTPHGHRVPTRRLPNWAFRLAARFDPTLRLALAFVGREEHLSSAKAADELGWTMRPTAETVVDTGRSLVEHGLARGRR
ncbi:SDR family oxidoreductase [Pseudonocardia humida]|uniref:Aldehyde reductase n=1 Tax=Pseudonocardia humida TaxID=2800819 RepID=A0ABT1A7B7_9PSEU|nr:aldehyde reductase [Pseudonocardia humida]MCO1658912.1 aldehyde reductase [Pseudonocardia humida]